MFNKLTIHFKWLFNLIKCQLFHKQIVRHFRYDGILAFDAEMYRGCRQCGLWQKVSDCHKKAN